MSPKEARRRSYLATRDEREQLLADEWRLSQAHHTRAPGTIAANQLRALMAEKLQEVRDLLELEVVWHVTPSKTEQKDMLETFEQLVEKPIPLEDFDPVRAEPLTASFPLDEPAPKPETPGVYRRFLEWLCGK